MHICMYADESQRRKVPYSCDFLNVGLTSTRFLTWVLTKNMLLISLTSHNVYQHYLPTAPKFLFISHKTFHGIHSIHARSIQTSSKRREKGMQQASALAADAPKSSHDKSWKNTTNAEC